MKKILLVTRPIAPPWDEASKNFAYFLAKNSPAFEFYLLTNGFLPNEPAHIHQKPIYTSNHLSYFQKARLLKLARMKNDFDIMHFMLTPNKLNTFSFKTFIKSKRAKTIQTIATLREDLFSDKDFKDILFADLIITYSDYAKNKLKALGFEHVVRIYPGIDITTYQETPKDEETCKHFSITPNDFVISYPGEYTRLGATDDIVAALPSLFEKLPNAKFVFACRVKNEKDARKKEEVVAQLTEKGILDKVVFTDTFADMPKLYNMSDVVVFPVADMKGKFDVPLAVIEAFACNKPVIISDLPILKEFASPDNSVIMKTGDMEQMIEEIVALHNNPEKRATIGSHARAYAQENFDIRNVAQQYQTVYDHL